MVTIVKAFKLTGVPVRTIRQYVVDGKIRAVKQGASWMIEESELDVLRQIKTKKTGVNYGK